MFFDFNMNMVRLKLTVEEVTTKKILQNTIIEAPMPIAFSNWIGIVQEVANMQIPMIVTIEEVEFEHHPNKIEFMNNAYTQTYM